MIIKVGNEKVELNTEKIGVRSLAGAVVLLMVERSEKSITLEFPQTTKEWKEKNNGPKAEIIYEHTIPLLLEDIIRITQLGIPIKIEMPEIIRE